MESEYNKDNKKEISFDFAKNDIKDIYLLSNISKTLLDDLDRWSKQRGRFKFALMNQIKLWVEQNKKEDMLVQTAKVSVDVIDYLLAKNVPFVVVEVYLNFLFYHRQKIEKYLNDQKANSIYIYVPTVLALPFLKLYRIKLSHKEKHSLIKEIIQHKDTCHDSLLAQLPKLFHNEQDYYADVLIRELQADRKQNIAGRVMKKLKIPKNQYPDICQALFQSAAIGLMKKDSEFTWQKLQQVFQNYPKALATCIKVFVNDKKTERLLIQGFASICRRNERLYSLMPKKVVQTLKKVQFELPNQLRNNRFLPSDPMKYFSLIDFQIKEKHVIWVEDKNMHDCLMKLSNEKLIGIDTESRVARTCLDKPKQLIATIQIATATEVYIFDAVVLKKNQIKVPQIQKFFNNKEVTVIGHTLSADLNGDVTQLLGFKGKVQCNAIDICPIFKILYPNEKRVSLAYISQKVLGKQICKEYTLTNWERRPLLKNQLHYAALDAVIVIKIWEKMRQHKNYEKAEKEANEKQKREERRERKTLVNGQQNESGEQSQNEQLEKQREALQK